MGWMCCNCSKPDGLRQTNPSWEYQCARCHHQRCVEKPGARPPCFGYYDCEMPVWTTDPRIPSGAVIYQTDTASDGTPVLNTPVPHVFSAYAGGGPVPIGQRTGKVQTITSHHGNANPYTSSANAAHASLGGGGAQDDEPTFFEMLEDGMLPAWRWFNKKLKKLG